MNVVTIRWIGVFLLILFSFAMGGCAGGESYKAYANAIKEQEVTRQLMIAQQRNQSEDRQRKHELKMTELMGTMAQAASASPDKTDDMMVPLLFMIMEDKFQMAEITRQSSQPLNQPIVMKAPETTGEMIRSSTGLVLGLGGIALGIMNSQNMADIAEAGLAAAGNTNTVNGDGNTLTSDSYKSGSQNLMGNSNSVNDNDVNGNDGETLDPSTCQGQPGYYVDADGVGWVSPGVSCESWIAGP
jgi:hypothetical protein